MRSVCWGFWRCHWQSSRLVDPVCTVSSAPTLGTRCWRPSTVDGVESRLPWVWWKGILRCGKRVLRKHGYRGRGWDGRWRHERQEPIPGQSEAVRGTQREHMRAISSWAVSSEFTPLRFAGRSWLLAVDEGLPCLGWHWSGGRVGWTSPRSPTSSRPAKRYAYGELDGSKRYSRRAGALRLVGYAAPGSGWRCDKDVAIRLESLNLRQLMVLQVLHESAETRLDVVLALHNEPGVDGWDILVDYALSRIYCDHPWPRGTWRSR